MEAQTSTPSIVYYEITPPVLPPNKAQKKLTKLEAIRGFAAAYVVLHHLFAKKLVIAGKDFSVLFRFGQEAVILFFLLSGFVIQYAYLKSKDKSFKTFFFKRFNRIYIPLICIFIANYIVILISNNGFSIDWAKLTGNLLMLQDVGSLKPNVICNPFLGNTPLWSLSYEWWFYMLFFVIVNKVKVNSSTFVYILSIIAAITYVIYPNFINRELMYLCIWWIGADMARLYVNGEKIDLKSLRVPLTALVLNIIILIINVKLLHNKNSIGVSPFLEVRHFLFALISIVGAILWSKIKWVGFNKTLGLFEILAPISFGIYISHWFLVIEANYFDKLISNVTLRYLGYIMVCVLFSYLVERVIYVGLNRIILKRVKV
jgi:peptidoglycan/LPS O-acetylase OafA/YrhL